VAGGGEERAAQAGLAQEVSLMLLLTYTNSASLQFPHPAMASPFYVKRLPPYVKPKWLDSGGYLALRRGAKLPTPQELCRLCEEVGAEVCFAPDIPPPPDADSLTYFRIEAKNFSTAEAAPCPLAPVVHVHPSPGAYAAALKLAVLAAEKFGVPLIGVGGAVPHLTAHRYALVRARALEALQAAGRVHLFGAGSPTTLTRLSLPPGASVDWAGWSLKASYGKIILPPEIGGGGERHVTDVKPHKKYPALTGREAEALRKWLEERGFAVPPLEKFIETLKKSYAYRAQVNAFVALKWYEIQQCKKRPASGV
jgi:hypothetical protein